MVIYFILYILIFICALFDLFISDKPKQVSLAILISLGVIMTLFTGLRWNTGTDWFNYQYYFATIETIPFLKSAMEPGYELFVRLFKLLISREYSPFLLFFSFCIIASTYYFLDRHSPYPIFSVFLLLSYSLVGSGFGVRQDIAICITLLSFSYIQERSLVKFASLVVLAAMFHNSAIIFLPAYWLYTFKWNTTFVMICVVAVAIAVLFSDTILSTFGNYIAARKIQTYMEEGDEFAVTTPLTIFKSISGRLLIFSFILWFVNYGENGNNTFNGIFNVYVFGIMIFVTFSPISVIFGRLARYYDIYQIVLIPLAYRQGSRLYKVVFLLIMLGFSILKFSTAILNDEAGAFVPYKSVLSE